MNVRILDEAEQDLTDGFRFYEMRDDGLGDYFLDSIFSDIDSLHLYAGIHSVHFGYHRLLSPTSLSLSTPDRNHADQTV